MMSLKAVIFDMDGTVLDTLEDLKTALNLALAQFNKKERTISEVRLFVGSGLKVLVRRALEMTDDEALLNQVLACFKKIYAENLNVYTHPYPGITELIKKLKERGIKVFISSNKFDYGAKELARAHFGNLIDMTLGESEEVPKKPDPTGALLMLKACGLSAEDAVYVGDSDVDIKTAANAGIDCICVSWGFRSKDDLISAGAGKIANSVTELEQLFGL